MSKLDILNRKLDRLIDQRVNDCCTQKQYAAESAPLKRAIAREEARAKSKAKAARHV